MNPSLRTIAFIAAVALLGNACVGLIGDEGSIDGAGDPPGPEDGSDSAATTQVMRIPNSIYRHALIDVLGLDEDLVDGLPLPTDGTLGGFTNHNDLFAGGPQAQAYSALGESVAELVVANGAIVADLEASCSADCLPLFIESVGRRLSVARQIGTRRLAADREVSTTCE
jgi:hypothetical protein